QRWGEPAVGELGAGVAAGGQRGPPAVRTADPPHSLGISVTERLPPPPWGPPGGSGAPPGDPPGPCEALAPFAPRVTPAMVADGRDDIGTTVSAFCPVSWSPPLVLVSLIADSYPAEVLSRLDRFAVTILRAGQRTLAGRFAVAGRPGARLLLEGTPHTRGE